MVVLRGWCVAAPEPCVATVAVVVAVVVAVDVGAAVVGVAVAVVVSGADVGGGTNGQVARLPQDVNDPAKTVLCPFQAE